MNLPDLKQKQQMLQRHAAQLLTEDQIKDLPPYQRQALGLAPYKLNRAQKFIESTPLLRQFGLLRRTFGLDKSLEPSMPFGTEEWLGGETYSWYNAQLAFELDRRSVYTLVEEGLDQIWFVILAVCLGFGRSPGNRVVGALEIETGPNIALIADHQDGPSKPNKEDRFLVRVQSLH